MVKKHSSVVVLTETDAQRQKEKKIKKGLKEI
jgi:hypothetical protein